MEAAGLVRYRREVRGVGGPRFAYSLSADGEALFPRAHAPTLVDALSFMSEALGPDAVTAFFRRRWAGIVAESGLDLAGLPMEDRVQLLAELLTSQGYMAEAGRDASPVDGAAEGGLTLRKYNCALREVAERFPELCAAEVAFMEEVLGARLDRRAHLLAGCNRCEYRVVEHEGGGRGWGVERAGTTPAAAPAVPIPLARRSSARAVRPASAESQHDTELRTELHQEQS
jgi:DeoR family suf operon transcriptional repressor